MKNKYIEQSVERLDIPMSEIDILKWNNINAKRDGEFWHNETAIK